MKKLLFFVCISSLFISTACSKEPRSKEYFKKNPDIAAEFMIKKCQTAFSLPPDSIIFKECVNADTASSENKMEKIALDYCDNIYKVKLKPETSLYVKECRRIEAEIKANKWDSSELNTIMNLFAETPLIIKYKGTEEYAQETTEDTVLKYCNQIYKERSATNLYVEECKRIETDIKADKWNRAEWQPRGLLSPMGTLYELDPFMLKKYGREAINVVDYCETFYKRKSANLFTTECERIETEIKANQWDKSEWKGSQSFSSSASEGLTPFLIKKYGQEIFDVLDYCTETYRNKPATNAFFKECKRIETEIEANKWDKSEWHYDTTGKYDEATGGVDRGIKWLIIKKYGKEIFEKDRY